MVLPAHNLLACLIDVGFLSERRRYMSEGESKHAGNYSSARVIAPGKFHVEHLWGYPSGKVGLKYYYLLGSP